MNKQEAQKEIDKLVQEAYDALRKAESIADDHALRFTFEVEYGMGGEYMGAGSEDDIEWLADYGIQEGNGGWIPSSHSC